MTIHTVNGKAYYQSQPKAKLAQGQLFDTFVTLFAMFSGFVLFAITVLWYFAVTR